jgi:hypothetical protein
MAKRSRRDFIKKAITLTSATVVAPAVFQAAFDEGLVDAKGTLEPRAIAASTALPYEIRSSARSPWVPVRVLDTERMPWVVMPGADVEARKYQSSRKWLFEDKETKAHLVITYRHPGWPGAPVHYHTFHEWGYMLSGDTTNNESTHPNQYYGPLMRFREGYFLSRPAFSLHGGERGRQDFMRSQVGASWFFMEEGDVAKETFATEQGTSMTYNPDYKKVKQWTVPRIIDTLDKMPWQPEGAVPGLHIKRLVDDQSRGFRATLWWLEPGWKSAQSPQFARAYYYKQGYQFNFVVAGDLKIQTYKAPGEKAEQIALGKYFYVERAPLSIFGLADGVVTERGCVWLEATYGKGCTVSTTPIEDPTYG